MSNNQTQIKKKKIAVFGCKHTTRDFIVGLSRGGVKVDECITISPRKAESQKVAGYLDLRSFLKEEKISCTVVNKYSLKDAEDQSIVTALSLDIVFCIGWQRLLPEWCLEQLSIGAFGMHGSNKPLPHGRGRSPMNWSLIQNKQVFFTHLFKYEVGTDDGPVVGVQKFDITPWDDCHTLHLKNTVSMIKLCTKHIPFLLSGEATLVPQSKEGICHYPKRTAEDGLLFWSDSTIDLFNLIRAVTHPFHGAFTFLMSDPDVKVTIWEAIPFDTRIEWENSVPGEIVEVFYDNSFVVKTGDSTILVRKWDGVASEKLKVGMRLHDFQKKRKAWLDLPR